MIRVGLFYNLRDDFKKEENAPIDANADWDIAETVILLKDGLEESGFEVIDIGNPVLLADTKVWEQFDLVFSICEMTGYRHREALVPSLCEMFDIPYVFSPPASMLISLDKNLCNFMVRQAGCKVPDWQLIHDVSELDPSRFTNYPYIVKPSAEGSGMGISQLAVVHTFDALQVRADQVLRKYQQPVIVQKFISGREFTVGVFETLNGLIAMQPVELSPQGSELEDFVYGYQTKEQADTLVQFVPVYGALASQLQTLAINSFKAIGCRDAGRVDIRLSPTETPFFLEINPLPHLHPEIGDFCRSARASGISYADLLSEIVKNAANRFNLVKNNRWL